ncbi:MAG: metal ABC transporter permease [Bradymonadaceae bacterium]|nr:metal ABC transporter permease [Lujinxingiaceae bacterium]
MNAIVAIDTSIYAQRAAEFFSFRYAFALEALGASILVGAICALVGTFLVLRGMSLIGDATGHATLPGVCVAFLLVGAKSMGALLAGALVSALAAALLIGVISRGPRTRPDAAIGIVLSVFFGFGIVLLSYIQNSPTGAQSGLGGFLFGNAAGISRDQLIALLATSLGLGALVGVFYRPLKLTVFDEGFARSIGIPTSLVQMALLSALAVCVVISIQAVGVVLVAAMLIIPPSAALFLSKRLGHVLLFAMLVGAVSGALGAFLSYMAEGVATGPAMVLVAAALFLGALFFGPRGGVVPSWVRRASSARAIAARRGG